MCPPISGGQSYFSIPKFSGAMHHVLGGGQPAVFSLFGAGPHLPMFVCTCGDKSFVLAETKSRSHSDVMSGGIAMQS